MPLRLRLAGLTTLLIAGTMALVLSVVYARQRVALLEQIQRERTAALEKLARISEATLDAKEERILLSYLGAWMKSDQVLGMALWDLKGRVQIHSRFLQGDYSAAADATADAFIKEANESARISWRADELDGRRRLRGAVPVTSGGKRFGSAVVDYDAESLDRELEAALRELISELVVIGGGVLVVAVLAAWLFAWNLTRPIEDLSRAAREIGGGKFDTSVEVRRRDELGQLGKELNRMAAQLRELEQMRDRFLQAVSHNMRSPLAAVTSAAYHARQLEANIPAGVEEDLRVIEAGIRELTRFVNNLLDLERLRAGRMQFNFRETNVVDLLDESRRLLERVAEEKGLRLTFDQGGERLSAVCDGNAIGEVVANLVFNALKFTPAGGAVALQARADGDAIRVTVRDNGTGIPADQLPNIVGRFRQFGDGQSRKGGSGLGLSLCKEFVEAHGGTIWAESTSGQGSAFHFTLPVAGPAKTDTNNATVPTADRRTAKA
ncbi:MAG: HAMP domain-containing histidine kinase [Elusimicrobia bacterium]|nr:HAMP domain-containing histidine kinase [Elusimicrobiota bacterium]